MTHKQWTWLSVASTRGGGFVSHFAEACLYADPENFALIESILDQMMEKYPDYLKG